MITDKVQQSLRNRGIIENTEVLKKEGDLYFAFNVLTQERRLIQSSQVLTEILTASKRHDGRRKVLKG